AEFGAANALVVVDRDLGDTQAESRGADDHLAGELHTGRTQCHLRVRMPPEGAQAAVSIADVGSEEHVEQKRQQRAADMAVDPGHRARFDPTAETVTYDQIGAAA